MQKSSINWLNQQPWNERNTYPIPPFLGDASTQCLGKHLHPHRHVHKVQPFHSARHAILHMCVSRAFLESTHVRILWNKTSNKTSDYVLAWHWVVRHCVNRAKELSSASPSTFEWNKETAQRLPAYTQKQIPNPMGRMKACPINQIDMNLCLMASSSIVVPGTMGLSESSLHPFTCQSNFCRWTLTQLLQLFMHRFTFICMYV